MVLEYKWLVFDFPIDEAELTGPKDPIGPLVRLEERGRELEDQRLKVTYDVVGYASDTGPDYRNRTLREDRATNFLRYIREFSHDMFEYAGEARAAPLDEYIDGNGTEAGRARNRSVLVVESIEKVPEDTRDGDLPARVEPKVDAAMAKLRDRAAEGDVRAARQLHVLDFFQEPANRMEVMLHPSMQKYLRLVRNNEDPSTTVLWHQFMTNGRKHLRRKFANSADADGVIASVRQFVQSVMDANNMLHDETKWTYGSNTPAHGPHLLVEEIGERQLNRNDVYGVIAQIFPEGRNFKEN